MPKIQAPLTDATLKSLKPREKIYRMSDGQNLFIAVEPGGRKFFVFEYKSPMTLKMRRYTMGNYPELTLAKARELRAELKKKISEGIDPMFEKSNTNRIFEKIAIEWIEKKSGVIKEHTAKTQLRIAQKHLFPYIGKRDISGIKAAEIIMVLQKIEESGAFATLKKAFQLCSQIWKFAVVSQRAAHNIMADIEYKYTFRAVKSQNYPTLIRDNDIKALVQGINEYGGDYKTKIALKLAIYTAARSFNIRAAQWSEFDLKKDIWNIDIKKMKQERDYFNLPMSRQVKSLLIEYKKFCIHSDFLFYSPVSKTKYMSENTLNVALRRMGYTKDELVFHGFRSMFSTVCNENIHIHGYSPDIIEKCLAHKEGNSVRAAYNRASNLTHMRGLMQWWADYLDNLA
ncbi:tyrosine-type recombinase/integrase [Campylobacter sp. MOP7]|uniref:tyrosine-type recombinase/integrase n=1 Tax=Campylobacter canis TaxID=3378588 RepID=UPI00387E479C